MFFYEVTSQAFTGTGQGGCDSSLFERFRQVHGPLICSEDRNKLLKLVMFFVRNFLLLKLTSELDCNVTSSDLILRNSANLM